MRANFDQLMQDYCADYEQAKSLGAQMLACNTMLVPAIAPHIALLIPNGPRPVTTYTEPAEVFFAGGLQAHRAGVPKTSHDGNIQMIETDFLQCLGLQELLMANGGTTDCIVYDGRPGRFLQAYELKDCAITFEPGEFDGEGRSTIQKISAPIKYMYFGVNCQLGSTNNAGQIKGTSSALDEFLNKSNQILNTVRAGNALVRAIEDLF